MFWITGSKGLLGSALTLKCKKLDLPFVETGRDVDIGDLNAVQAFVNLHPGITHIINCAAFSQVDAAETCREEAYKTNVLGPDNLGLIAKNSGAKLIHISTDYVFSGKIRRLLTELDPVGPTSYYGQSKLEGEERALAHSACVIRTSWIFGRGGKNFVSKLLKMLQTQKEIRLTDDQWGRFTYAPDLAGAILALRDQTGLYQFANAGVATKYEFGLAMREEAFLLNFPIMAEAIVPVPGAYFPAPCERPVYSALDTSKIESFVSIRHWREPLKDFLCEEQPVYL
jgi:dTDP-4-dehydrorhamnose reductase